MAETPRQIVERVAREVGIDPVLAWTVALQESSGNPRAHNPNGEDSWGLFQGNRNGGLGSGYSPDQLMDPEFNARLMLSHMAQTQARNPQLKGGELAAASQRPADARGYARSVNAMLTGGRGMPHTGSPFSPTGGSQAVANPLIDTITKEIESLGRERDIAISNAQSQREGATVLRERLPVLDTEYASSTERAAYNAAVKEVESREKEAERFEAEADRLRTQISTKNERLATEQGKDAANAAKDSESRVVGRALVDAQGNVIYRDPTETSQRAGFHQVDTGTEVIILDDTGAELRRIPKQRDVKYGTDPSTGATFIMLPDGSPGQKIFEGKGEKPTNTTVNTGGRVTGIRQNPDGTVEAAGMVDTRTPEQQSLDLLTAQIAIEKATQLQAALDAANAFPAGSVERRQALQGAVMEAARYSDPQVILREAELEATKQRDAENVRTNTATAVRGLMGLENSRSADAAQARNQHMKSGLGSLRDQPEFQRMTQPIDPQMAAQAVGMDPNSPKFQAIWSAWNQSTMGGGGQQMGQPVPEVTPEVTPPDPRRAAAIVTPPRQQAYDLAGVGNPGYALNLSVQNGVAEQMGNPYDIQEAGNGAPAGPPPGDIASVIEALGFKRKQLQTA